MDWDNCKTAKCRNVTRPNALSKTCLLYTSQYIAEVLLIAVFAFAASGITSNMFAATVADTLLQQTVQSNSLQDNAEDDTTMQSIDMSSALEDEETISPNIQISLGLEDLLRLYCIGFFIIVVSVTVSSVSVMRLKPRDILNRMS